MHSTKHWPNNSVQNQKKQCHINDGRLKTHLDISFVDSTTI